MKVVKDPRLTLAKKFIVHVSVVNIHNIFDEFGNAFLNMLCCEATNIPSKYNQ